MGKIIAVVNQKGGVGKTTTAVNLTAILADMGQRVLVVDLDPQGNTTSGLGRKAGDKSIYEALLGRETLRACMQDTAVRGLTLVGADIRLAGAELELVEAERREFRLKEVLGQVKAGYDFIFIDCPPSLELLTLNALCAADAILVPVQGEYYALEGLSDLMNTVRIVRRSLNPRLELDGVLLTMFDGRTNLALQVAEEVKHYFPGKVYATVIPRNVRLSEAPSHGKPITAYDRTSRGAEAYTAFAAEFLKKQSA